MVKIQPFVDDATQKVHCWSPAKKTAREFCVHANIGQQLKNKNSLFFGRTPIVTLFMPIKQQFFLSKSVRIQGTPTFVKVLETIETFIKDAIAYWYGHESVEGVDTLSGFTTCHLMVSRAGGYNKIYIRTPSDAGREPREPTQSTKDTSNKKTSTTSKYTRQYEATR
jgi:hypothetical protein